MIFKSRQVNLDPLPWITDDFGVRWSGAPDEMPGLSGHYDPRPEFEPTRDPKPYVREVGHTPENYWRVAEPRKGYYWNPRREQFDTPVNPILAVMRLTGEPASFYLYAIERGLLDAFTREQIDHAKKVLTRLAAMEESK
jgi:hypothetical protein